MAASDETRLIEGTALYLLVCVISASSMIAGLQLARRCSRTAQFMAYDVVTTQHKVAVLHIIKWIGLIDAIYAAGFLTAGITGVALPRNLQARPWLRLSSGPAACVAVNAILFPAMMAQSMWQTVLAWHVGGTILDSRPATDWAVLRCYVHAFVWGVTLATSWTLVPVCQSICLGESVSSSRAQGGEAFIAIMLIISLLAVLYNGYMYLRVLWHGRAQTLLASALLGTLEHRRRAQGQLGRRVKAMGIEARLTSYLAAFFLCQLAQMIYHLSCLLPGSSHPVANSAPVFYEENQGWLLWVWYATQPLQGLVDALVYAHHAHVPNEETSSAFPHHTGGGFPELSERLTESTADESAHAELEDDESPARLSTVNE